MKRGALVMQRETEVFDVFSGVFEVSEAISEAAPRREWGKIGNCLCAMKCT